MNNKSLQKFIYNNNIFNIFYDDNIDIINKNMLKITNHFFVGSQENRSVVMCFILWNLLYDIEELYNSSVLDFLTKNLDLPQSFYQEYNKTNNASYKMNLYKKRVILYDVMNSIYSNKIYMARYIKDKSQVDTIKIIGKLTNLIIKPSIDELIIDNVLYNLKINNKTERLTTKGNIVRYLKNIEKTHYTDLSQGDRIYIYITDEPFINGRDMTTIYMHLLEFTKHLSHKIANNTIHL